ncbi:uncharacterized protein BO66DRAFT_458312, partial [Aspergillus aculeatinus CBS 121060]
LREHLFKLQRLSLLVSEPEDIGGLIRCEYHSAEQISRSEEGAISALCGQGVPRARAQRIYYHALRVTRRNESLCFEALKARGTGGKMDLTLNPVQSSTPSGSMDVNLSTIFGVDSMGCEDCASVTGPAAFFVDIMQSLRKIELEDSTMLDLLLQRRPNLGDLQLSCANTEILIPYVDLVNEILESVIWGLETNEPKTEISVPRYDMDRSDTSGQCIEQPQHTNLDLYSQIVQTKVAPLFAFPYNQAIHSIRTFLNVLGTSRRQLLDAFQPPYNTGANIPRTTDGGYSEACVRAQAAEVLNLQHEDFVAITKEGFYPFNLAEAPPDSPQSRDDYNGRIGLRTASQYWGYDDDGTMTSENGLTSIKAQLLPRSGMSFDEILTLLHTKYLDKRLVIEIPNSSATTAGSLPGLEYIGSELQWPLVKDMSGTASLPTDETCDRVQAFLRLRNKLKWSFQELDAMIDTLSTVKPPTIDALLLTQVAAVQKLSEITKLPPINLQPLWGNFNTHACESLYNRLFLGRRLSETEREAFTPDETGALRPGEQLESLLHAILVAFSISVVEYEAIKAAVDMGDNPDLSMEHLSEIYRVATLCKVLGFSPVDYTRFCNLHPTFQSPFQSPRTTLQVVQGYPPLKPITKDWTLGDLSLVVNGDASATDTRDLLSVDKCLDLLSSLRANDENHGQATKFAALGARDEPHPRSHQSILNTLRTHFASFDMAALVVVMAQKSTSSPKTYMEILVDLSVTASPDGDNFEGYFRAPATDTYRIACKEGTTPEVSNLAQYNLLKKESEQKHASMPLTSFYHWAFSKDKKDESLAVQISQTTGWSEKLCTEFLDAKYAQVSEGDRIKHFQNISSLFEMRNSMNFVTSAGLHTIPFKSLFDMARPRYPNISIDFQEAASIRAGAQSRAPLGPSDGSATALSTAFDIMRDSQRSALVQYLASMKAAQTLGISSTDQLLSYFLIDVEMGSGLQTSRLKQAISTVQLFIRRCSLGLEGSECQRLIMTLDLDYVLRYRLWEASRKAFLYAENWLDPTLRDDKSEQFQQLESAIVQGKVDSETITTIVKDYIHKTSEVANLRVESYALEIEEDEVHHTIHILGRDRTSPPSFYYRTVRIPTNSLQAPVWTPLWTPWTRLTADIPVHATDHRGLRLDRSGSYLVPKIHQGVLYVFLPELVPQQENTYEPSSVQPGSSGNDDVGTVNVTRQWHIRMGFMKLQNRKWSPREVADSTIIVPAGSGDESQESPNNSHFKFWIPYDEGGSLKIDVEWIKSLDPRPQPVTLGTFEVRDQHLVLLNKESYPTSSLKVSTQTGDEGQTIFTEFVKFRKPKQTNPPPPVETSINHGGAEINVRLAQLPSQSQSFIPEWTLDFNYPFKGQVTGLFLELSDTTTQKHYVDLEVIHGFELTEFMNRFSPGFLASMKTNNGIDTLYDHMRNIGADDYQNAFGQWHDPFEAEPTDRYHEGAMPFALYNWEIGVHIPSLLFEHLLSTQQLDLALKIARLVFDPRVPSQNNADINWCWSFPPFREDSVRLATVAHVTGETSFSEDEYRESKGNVHAAARANPVAYMKRIAFKYIECLLAMGDQYFRQDTLESIPFAIQMYTEASQLFGPPPVEIPQLGTRVVKSYNDIKDSLDDFSNGQVDLEVEFPFYADPASRGRRCPAIQPLATSLKTPYFCFSGNPYLQSLRSLIDDRLLKIRHGMDINGTKRRLPLLEPSIDPGALMQAFGAGGSGIAGLLGDFSGPMPNYRFSYLLQRALELASELKSLGQKVQTIKEKNDAEALAQLRLTHQQSLLSLASRVKEHRTAEVRKTTDSLTAMRQQQVMKLQYYLRLTGDEAQIPKQGDSWHEVEQDIKPPSTDDLRKSPEDAARDAALEAMLPIKVTERVTHTTAAGFLAMPKESVMTLPMGIGVTTEIPTENVGKGLKAMGAAFGIGADIQGIQSQLAARSADAKRQLQDRRLQANIAGYEIMKIDRQIQEASRRLDTLNAEVESQQHEMESSMAEAQWLRTKYTNQELYRVFDRSMSTVFHRTYLLTMDLVRLVQRALDFEFGSSLDISTTGDLDACWENAQDGQTCGEIIYLELKRLETLSLQNKTHDFEVLKTVSLRELDPKALLSLCETGVAQFDLPETISDLDFPGHFRRWICSVAVSVRCRSPAPMSLSCTVTLLANRYRVSSDASNYRSPGRVVAPDNIPIQSIAVSRGTNDTGVLDLRFRDTNHRYTPFEGAGIISTWRIEFPSAIRTFDLRGITDVVLDIGYTAADGGGGLREAATEAARQTLQGSGETLSDGTPVPFYVGIELPRLPAGNGTLEIERVKDRFPFWAREAGVVVRAAWLYLKPGLGSEDMAAALEDTGSIISVNGSAMAKAPALGQYAVWEAAGVQWKNTWVVEGLPAASWVPAWLVVDFYVQGI